MYKKLCCFIKIICFSFVGCCLHISIALGRPSDGKTGQQVNLGPILVVYGTPNAGKRTICDAFIQRAKTHFPEGMWVLDSFDKEWSVLREKRKGKSRKEIVHNLVKADAKLLALYNAIKMVISPEYEKYIVMYAWRKGGLRKDIPEGVRAEFTQSLEVMENLDKLKVRLRLLIGELNDNEYDFLPRIVERALKRSNAGLGTILDLVSLYGRDLDPVAEVEKLLKKASHRGCRHYALIHVSLRNLIDRIDERNEIAIKTGNLSNQRGYRNLLHYLFTYAQEPVGQNQEPISTLTREDHQFAVGKLKDHKASQEILKTGYYFPDDVDQINIYPKLYFDSIHNSTSRESTSRIVDSLMIIAKGLLEDSLTK